MRRAEHVSGLQSQYILDERPAPGAILWPLWQRFAQA